MPLLLRNKAQQYDDASLIQAKTFDELLRLLGPEAFKSVLDIGCSTGKRTFEFHKKFPSSKIVGVDPLSDKIRFAQEKYKNITFYNQELLSFDQTGFDLVLANASLQWMSPLNIHIEKIYACLGKKGTCLAAVFGPETFKEWQVVLESLNKKAEMPTQFFPKASEVEAQFKAVFEEVTLEKVRYKNKFVSLVSLLKSIRETGTGGHHGRGLWTPRFLAQAETLYQQLFGGIYATYDVFLIKAEKI